MPEFEIPSKPKVSFSGVRKCSIARAIHQFTKPAHRADQVAFAHTMKAPAPSLSLGGGLIYDLDVVCKVAKERRLKT